MNVLVKRMAALSLPRARVGFSALLGAKTDGVRMVASYRRPWGLVSTQCKPFSTKSPTSTQTTASALEETTTAAVFTDNTSGQKFGMVLDTRHLPKLKPGIVKRRLARCKTYVGTEKAIRQSPWKLNRICQLAAGLTLEEALTQLQFCSLKNADLVTKVLRRTSN